MKIDLETEFMFCNRVPIGAARENNGQSAGGSAPLVWRTVLTTHPKIATELERGIA